MNAQDVIDFWFEEIDEKSWWQKDASFDALISERFGIVHQQACVCELSHWRETTLGRLAEIIVLDQFSRNIFRDDPRAFSGDAQALILSQTAIAVGADQALESDQKAFLYMPFMHSESMFIHEQALQLFDAPGLEPYLKFEHKHKAIIDRFGRYPHRNKALNRFSTQEEKTFLLEPNSSF